jgi:DNA polymerase-3 subunit beta
LPAFERKKGWVLDQKTLKDLIRKTSYAISKDETRYVLNGLNFSFQPNKVIVVATDGRRLALAQAQGKFSEGEKEIILPSKAVLEISKVLKEEGQVELIPFENQIAFVFKNPSNGDGGVIISRLVEGNFPNYKQVVPEKVKESVVLEREEFFSAIRRVAVVTNEKSSLIKLGFTKNLLTLTANTPDVGEAKEEIPLSYEGQEQVIAFNPTYLTDVLKSLDDKEITFEFNDALSPGVVREGTAFIYVIMPMRIA